jgi:hypothetical protein
VKKPSLTMASVQGRAARNGHGDQDTFRPPVDPSLRAGPDVPPI